MAKQRYKSNRRGRLGFASGQSAPEFAIAIPVLILLLLTGADFARAFYTSTEVANAARAGAQYGSQSVVTAADSNGIALAARNDAANISGMNVTSSYCTCQTPTPSGQTACASSYCTDSPEATYVEVDTSAVFNTVVTYPGIPSQTTIPGKAIMQVQQ